MASYVLALAMLALVVALGVAARVVVHRIDRLQPPDTPATDVLEVLERLGRLEENLFDDGPIFALVQEIGKRVDDLTIAMDEGIKHVDRAEKRIRGIAQGAQRRFEKAGLIDAGVDAEVEELQAGDARGIDPQGVLPLPSGMGVEEVATPENPFPFTPGRFA